MIKDSVEINAIPKDDIKQSFLENETVTSVLDSGGLLGLIMIPCLVSLVVGIYCLIQCTKKAKACRCLFKLLLKLKIMVMFNLVIRVFTLGFLPNTVSSGLGRNLNTLGDLIPVNWFLLSGIMVWVGLVTYFVLWIEHP